MGNQGGKKMNTGVNLSLKCKLPLGAVKEQLNPSLNESRAMIFPPPRNRNVLLS